MTEESIFARALEQTSKVERAAILEQACAGDKALRRRVESLLESHEEREFLRTPAVERAAIALGAVATLGMPAPAAGDDRTSAEQPGTAIGPYKLLQKIGEGGMGTVFMAEQTEPVRRTVALKLIKAGMDTRQVLARFGAERQALALMDHPNIARALDAGVTETGRPYFVMELVKGVPITRFCDERRLTPRERLELFISVCQGVQHAHQKGIIHRDLNPSNVLVALYDGQPVPKIIDFGVAKATGARLTDATLFTGFGTVVGTPKYMSPEQAELNQLDIDTRSDIYSLGVLLYELLTGSTPLQPRRLKEATLLEMLRLIHEEEPPRPSTRLGTTEELPAIAANRSIEPRRLMGLVRGELDWIVMKALEKDRNRRYETAGGFADDVRRYLDDQPVRAYPPSAWYRSRKLVRRHKTGALLACALAAAMLSGLAILATSRSALAQEQRQTRAALRAETRAKEGLDAALRRERVDLYFARIARAEREWALNNQGRAEELLAACPADLRGWEWHYLKRQRLGGGAPLRPAGPVISVALSPDDRTVASSTGGQVTIRDLATGVEVHSLRAHEGQVQSLTFSPDGRRLASAGLDGTVKIWDTGSWEELQIFRGHSGGVLAVAFDPGGAVIASAGADRTVRIWGPADGREIATLSGHGDAVFRLAFSPDGHRLASASFDRTVRVWDLETRREVVTFRGHDGMVRSVAFSPDGRRVASADGTIWKSDDGVVKVWDADTGVPSLTLRGHVGEVSALAFSPDGRRLASGGADQTLRLWDADTGREALLLRGHEDLVSDIAFSRDGCRLASASLEGAIRIWDARPLGGETGREVAALRAGSRAVFAGVVFSRDGRRLASAGADHTVKIWEAGSWKDLLTLTGHTDDVSGVAFSPDGTRLASASGRELIVWDAIAGRRLVSAAGADRAVAFSPDGRSIASADGFEVRVRDAATGAVVRSLRGHQSLVLHVAFSPDGRHLASASSDLTVRLWEPGTGRLIHTLTGHTGRVCALAFHPDGKRLATASLDRTVRVWDVGTGATTSTLRDPTAAILGLTYSPDGRHLAWTGMDATVKVSDADNGAELVTFRGHTRWVFGVAFTPDGRSIASAGADGTVRIWDATQGAP